MVGCRKLIRDFRSQSNGDAALGCVGSDAKAHNRVTDSEINLLDRVSEITLAGDHALPDLRQIYQDDRLRVSEVIFNASRQMQEKAES